MIAFPFNTFSPSPESYSQQYCSGIHSTGIQFPTLSCASFQINFFAFNVSLLWYTTLLATVFCRSFFRFSSDSHKPIWPKCRIRYCSSHRRVEKCFFFHIFEGIRRTHSGQPDAKLSHSTAFEQRNLFWLMCFMIALFHSAVIYWAVGAKKKNSSLKDKIKNRS